MGRVDSTEGFIFAYLGPHFKVIADKIEVRFRKNRLSHPVSAISWIIELVIKIIATQSDLFTHPYHWCRGVGVYT